MPKRQVNPSDYIIPLNVNRLEGRMLHYPSNRKRKQEILFVYGQRSSIERWWGLIEFLHDFGTVTVPDLPGFGGMDSFYKIGKTPSLDTYAGYLASLIKMQYRHKHLVLVGEGYGFMVITRMLQLYPDLVNSVKLLISLDGIADYDDLVMPKLRFYSSYLASQILRRRFPSLLVRYLGLNAPLLRFVYTKRYQKLIRPEKLEDFVGAQIKLWHQNDFQSYMSSRYELLTFSNCQKQIPLPVQYVASGAGTHLELRRIEQHLKVIFNHLQLYRVRRADYAHSTLISKVMAAQLIPPKLRKTIRSC